MSSHKPIVGIIFLVGLAAVTGGAAVYTAFLPPPAHCPSTPVEYTINATAHQFGFTINGTDATKNGWTICHNSIVHFMVRGMWEHNAEIGANFTQHGFYIAGLITPVTIPAGNAVSVTVTFDKVGTFILRCTIPCSTAQWNPVPYGSHESMAATITVV